MCRYIIGVPENDTVKVIGVHHDYNKACNAAEDWVKGNAQPCEVFERVSTAKPTTAVVFEGRRRPGVGA